MGVSSYPKRLYLELSNACNLNCEFCLPSKRPVSFLPITLVEKVMSESCGICDYFYLHVQGEPLLYPHLAEVLALAESYQRKIQLVTNGSLLKENQELLSNAKAIRKLSISLQSLFQSEQLEVKLRDLAEFLRVVKAKDLTVELRVWSKENPKIMTFLNETFGRVFVFKENTKIRERLYLNYEAPFSWPKSNGTVKRSLSYCIGPKLMLCVLSDGSLTPCCLDINGELSLGNVATMTLIEALESERYLKIIKGFQNNKVIELLCKHCNYGEQL